MQINIDFSDLENMSDFYEILKQELSLPNYFGENLDALFDVISGDVELPLHIHFINMNLEQLENFSSLIDTMKDLEREVEGFTFRYAIDLK